MGAIKSEYAASMAKDASVTREQLIRAGERLFARKGVDGALTREIVLEARQSNGSAVHYHFGSRQGLLRAIAEKHIARMEPARAAHLASLARDGSGDDLAAVARGVVDPVADELATPDGRDFVRIIAQLAGHAGVRTATTPAAIAGTALAQQLVLLEERCRDDLPEPLARERLATGIGMLTAALADRARQLDDGREPLLSHAVFVQNLTSMLVAALQAPLPDERL